MPPARALVAVLVLISALIIDLAVLSLLHLPGGPPRLTVVALTCIALVEGAGPGALLGFCAGGLSDLLSDHPLGRLALVYCLIGYFVGLVSADADRSALVPLGTVAAASGAAVLVDALVGVITGDPRILLRAVGSLLVAAVLYDVVLTPLVYPPVRLLLRRIAPDGRV